MAVKQEKKKSFNFVDIILLIIILAVVSSLVYLLVLAYNDLFLKGGEDAEIEYVLRIEGVDNDVRFSVKEGDTLVELGTHAEIGTVVDFYEEPSEFVGYDKDGKQVLSDDPSKRDLILIVRTDAKGEGSVYEIDSYTISVGTEVDFRIPGFTAVGECISLEVKSDE